ncbi:MAG: cytochrome b N-terminal domain-containing protein [Myxococcota bacterium]
MNELLSRLLDAIDDRTGYRKTLADLGGIKVKGGPSWAYVLGATTMVLFLVLAVTGIALAAFYSPSVTDAWASVAYLESRIPFGMFLRAVHQHAHSAFVILLALHILQVVIWGAYKAPREATWLSGVVMFVLATVFSLTGYLLPFDQNAYWSTKVRMGIVGSGPVIGEYIPKFLSGGNELGNLSLTRFYTFHVLILPLAMLLFLGLHLAFFRRHGPAPSANKRAAELAVEEPYWPRQITFDVIGGLVAILAVFIIAHAHPAPLEAPADPAASYIGRPEWYFLFLFQALKYFHGPLEVVGKVGIPTGAMLFLAALPFLDKAPSRALRDRKWVIGVVALALFLMGTLSAIAVDADRHDAAITVQRKLAPREAERAKKLALAGVPVEGASYMAAHDPLIRGERVFQKECASCHPFEGIQPEKIKGPDLTGFNSKAWIKQALRDPDSIRLYGKTKVHGMKSFADKMKEAELNQMVDYVYSLRRDDAKAPDDSEISALWDEHECGQCHETGEKYGLDGPALFKYGTEEWVMDVVKDASADFLYDKDNSMPVFEHRLAPEDLKAVVAFMMTLEGRADPTAWPFINDPGPVPTPRTLTATASKGKGKGKGHDEDDKRGADDKDDAAE